MSWKISKREDGRIKVSVTGDELRHIIPDEAEELIDEHNENVVPYNEGYEPIDLDKIFSERSCFSFYVDAKDITIKGV